MSYFGQTTYYEQDAREVHEGSPADSRGASDISLVNDDPRTAQVDTIVVDTATNDHVYTFKIDGVTISYTADGTATLAEIADGLAAAVNAAPLVNGRVSAASNGVDTVTLTARVGGVGFTTTEVDALCTLTNTTANGTADTVGFGRLVIDGGITGVSQTPMRRAKLAKAANLTAKVVTLTPANVNDAVYFVHVTVDGVTYVAEYTADASATVKEIVDAFTPLLNGLLPANTVVVTDDDTALTLTAEVAGKTFSVAVGSSNATATWTVTDTDLDTDDLNRCARGVTLYEHTREQDGSDVVEYAAGSVMSVRECGAIYVQPEDTVTTRSPVYARVSGSGTIAGFRGSAGTGCIKLRNARWDRVHTSGRAVLLFDFRFPS